MTYFLTLLLILGVYKQQQMPTQLCKTFGDALTYGNHHKAGLSGEFHSVVSMVAMSCEIK
jgi:hypothetical protein